jgi:O-antigen/teichoic acid export membrane protein
MNLASIKIRFLATMITNVLRAGISFIAGLAIARYLGPEDYGNYNFLLGSFTAMVSLLDMGTSTAFYTFISQGSRGKRFYLYYVIWVFFRLSLLLLFVFLVPDDLREQLWLGHPKESILLALLAVFSMNQIWQFVGQVGESIRDTVGVQVRNLVLAICFLGCIVLLTKTDILSISALFVTNMILYFALSFLYGVRLHRSPVLVSRKDEDIGDILREFKNYCAPLLLYTWVGFLYAFADYWLLQRFGGAVQQGYYAVGIQFASISLLATTSMIQVFWKEIADAHARGNVVRTQELYHKVSRSLFFLGAFASCILIPFSREILSLLLGPAYEPGWPAFALMLFYPIHQSLGQVTSTMLYALGKTKMKAFLGLIFMGISIMMTVIFLAPQSWIIPGFQLGAIGLALKMVICQFLDVTLMGICVARYISTQYEWTYQIQVILVLLSAGFISKFAVCKSLAIFNLADSSILHMTVAGLLYLSLVSIFLWHRPALSGIESAQIQKTRSWIKKNIPFM